VIGGKVTQRVGAICHLSSNKVNNFRGFLFVRAVIQKQRALAGIAAVAQQSKVPSLQVPDDVPLFDSDAL
jgi:hypothetical protein